MNRFSNSELTDMHMMYVSVNGIARLAERLYAERFSKHHLLDHRDFTRLHQRLRDTGSFEVSRREASGRRRLVSQDMKSGFCNILLLQNPTNKHASHGK